MNFSFKNLLFVSLPQSSHQWLAHHYPLFSSWLNDDHPTHSRYSSTKIQQTLEGHRRSVLSSESVLSLSQQQRSPAHTHTHTHTVNTTSTWSLRQPFIILFWVQKCRWEWSRTRAERDKETINPWPQSNVTAWTGHCVNAAYLKHTDALWLFAFTLRLLAKVTYINIAFKMHNWSVHALLWELNPWPWCCLDWHTNMSEFIAAY